ncbi:hypothetical protein AURDEDRAFT_171354 [Auricularia subglabra TFB-10046 SS5]|uniref:Nudix hydrolase domain-containing protein n=1 Tax=Auricularia subglabra (strain TFB-10046 / SS5) TaxID=717982 RepID=J0D1C0_AURST|nr:hypothetical protein AURDEDRAFT_171354 [Auricularia subglabra TFB-10046 SS5]
MPDTRRPVEQAVRHTVLSHRVLDEGELSCADVVYHVGAVIWHPESKLFLLFITRKGPYKLPTQSVEGNLIPSLADPVAFVAQETGHHITPVRLRKFERLYTNATAKSNDDVKLVAVTSSESTEPFKVTVNTLCDTEGTHWGQSRQVVTMWFAGTIIDPDAPAVTPAKPTASTVRVGHLLPANYVLKYLSDRGYVGEQEYSVMEGFIKLWNLTYPDNRIRSRDLPSFALDNINTVLFQ